MADAAYSRQLFRKLALVFAYTLVAGFGAAAMLIMQGRSLDERGQMVVGIISAGAFCGAAVIMLFAGRFMRYPPLLRFIAVFFGVMLATLFMQGILAGGIFNMTALAEYGPHVTFNNIVDMSFTPIYGFAYYMVYGSVLIWPVAFMAALLFALGFLTLRPQSDTTKRIKRSRQ